jgi:hypothetical protein
MKKIAGAVVVERQSPGNNGVLGKDKISRQSKHPQPLRIAKPPQLPLAKEISNQYSGRPTWRH